jgi:hypothetical protein
MFESTSNSDVNSINGDFIPKHLEIERGKNVILLFISILEHFSSFFFWDWGKVHHFGD